MRFTIINQFYAPDLSPTAHLAASLAEHRAEVGDDVTVVTSRGGYVPATCDVESQGSDNPRVLRVWTPRLGKANIIKRCLDYGCFYLLAAWHMLTLPRQDVIVALTTPPFIAWTAVLHKMLHPGAHVVLWNMDCYPEVIERAGIIKEGKLPSRIMQAMNRALFRRLDHLVCLDSAMLDLLCSRYDRHNQLPATIVPNWEKSAFFKPKSLQASAAAQADPSLRGKLVVLYSGNMGCGHSFDTVIDAAERLRDDPVVFLFVGGGSQLKVVEKAVQSRGLSNIIMKGYVEREELLRIMSAAHCSLVTLRDEMLGVMSPSKLHANLAMGLPAIYIGPRGSNVDEAIKRFNCGASLRHGESFLLTGVIRTLLSKPHRLAELRVAARRAFDTAYCADRTLPLFDAMLDQFIDLDVLAVAEESLAVLSMQSEAEQGHLAFGDVIRDAKPHISVEEASKKAA